MIACVAKLYSAANAINPPLLKSCIAMSTMSAINAASPLAPSLTALRLCLFR